MAENKQRKLFTKEGFLEGNRQKWCVVYLIAGSIILGLDAYHLLKDPTPYLTFLTFLAGAFILGYSGSETMKLFRANSQESDQNVDEKIEQTTKEDRTSTETVNENVVAEGSQQAPAIRPYSVVAVEE